MLRFRRVDIGKNEEIFRKINDYINEVIKRLDPSLVILFGSFATGDINEGSDIDLLVVANFKEDFLERIKTLLDINIFRVPIEPVGYTPQEFEGMKSRKNSFIIEVLEKGKIIYKK